MRAMTALVLAAALAAPGAAGADATGEEEAWLDALYDRVGGDVGAGRPLVVQAHVPLCDNRILRCGGHGLGDGDAPKTNLYWATSGGFVGWFGRRGSGWKQVLLDADGDGGDVLQVRAWRRRITPGKAWKARGVKEPFDVLVVAYAWRGTAIDAALEAYAADLYGGAARVVTLDDGTAVDAGGAARVVAFVGHNRWMDLPPYDWQAAERTHGGGGGPKGTIALACHTAAYLGADVPAAGRVPLLMTADFLFAGAHAFEGAVRAFAEGGSYAAIRAGAAESYAAGQGKPVKKVRGAFTNPADWHDR